MQGHVVSTWSSDVQMLVGDVLVLVDDNFLCGNVCDNFDTPNFPHDILYIYLGGHIYTFDIIICKIYKQQCKPGSPWVKVAMAL